MSNKESLETRVSRFLFKYRITPHSTTGIAPAEMLMSRKLRSRLDVLHPDVRQRVQDQQKKQKDLHDQHAVDRQLRPVGRRPRVAKEVQLKQGKYPRNTDINTPGTYTKARPYICYRKRAVTITVHSKHSRLRRFQLRPFDVGVRAAGTHEGFHWAAWYDSTGKPYIKPSGELDIDNYPLETNLSDNDDHNNEEEENKQKNKKRSKARIIRSVCFNKE
ncbi:Hypothetical predicted protein, partial [Paramuricea clavata]